MALINKSKVFGYENFPSKKIEEDLNFIFHGLEDYNPKKLSVFVHGSFADDTLTEFSDLDDFIIVDDDYYNVVLPFLNEAELKMQKRDPLQHHGHWLIRKSQLDDYDYSYFPLFILEDSIRLNGDGELFYNSNLVKFKKDNLKRLQATLRNIKFFSNEYFEQTLNVYNLKRFVSSIALVFPLAFQLKDQFIGKREAINRADEILSDKGRILLDWASDLRNNWSVIIENEKYKTFSKEINNYKEAQNWRNFAENNSPVLEYSFLFGANLTKEIVSDFISEIMVYVDSQLFKSIPESHYEISYKEIEKEAIKNKAIIVGKFGKIEHPGISDLDVFISFKDGDYKMGCQQIINYIENSSIQSYMFAHSPLFVPESLLQTIGELHTMDNLVITHNQNDSKITYVKDESYKTFLNKVWSFTFFDSSHHIYKNIDIINLRTVLLALKNLQRSLYFIEGFINGDSDEMKKNDALRNLVLENGISESVNVRNEYRRVYNKLTAMLAKTDSKLKKNRFKKRSHTFIMKSNEIHNPQITKEYMELNPLYFDLYYEICGEKTKDSRRFLKSMRFYYKKSQIIGGYKNMHINIVPYSLLYHNFISWKVLSLKIRIAKFLKKKIK